MPVADNDSVRENIAIKKRFIILCQIDIYLSVICKYNKGLVLLQTNTGTTNVFLFSIFKFYTLHCRVFVPKNQVSETKNRDFEEGVCVTIFIVIVYVIVLASFNPKILIPPNVHFRPGEPLRFTFFVFWIFQVYGYKRIINSVKVKDIF